MQQSGQPVGEPGTNRTPSSHESPHERSSFRHRFERSQQQPHRRKQAHQTMIATLKSEWIHTSLCAELGASRAWQSLITAAVMQHSLKT